MCVLGLFELETSIKCRKEVLGESFRTKINGIDVNVIFPSYDQTKDGLTGMNHMLIPPVNFGGFHKEDEELAWGSVREYPSGISSVDIIAMEFNLNPDDSEKIQLLQNEISLWGHSLIEYIFLITKQSVFGGVEIFGSQSSCWLFSKETMERIKINSSKGIEIVFTMEDDKVALSIENMNDILLMLSTKKEIKLEYQLLLEAYNSRKEKKLRQAVIDAAAGFEICLIRMIKSHCLENGLNSKKKLNRKTLGQILYIIKNLGIESDDSIIKNFSNNILNLRNDVAHGKNLKPSIIEVNSLLEEVRFALDKYSSGYLEL